MDNDNYLANEKINKEFGVKQEGKWGSDSFGSIDKKDRLGLRDSSSHDNVFGMSGLKLNRDENSF